MPDFHPSEAGAERPSLGEEAEKNLLIQTAINSVLRISLEPVSLDEQLLRILNHILDLPWLALEHKGCVFLADKDLNRLVMRAQVGMSAGVLSTCSEVEFGKCLCGSAFLANRVVFSCGLDARHSILYPGVHPHGHYCVPINSGQERLGLLNLYVREGHSHSPTEERFLRAVSDVLAGIIERRTVEESALKISRLPEALSSNGGHFHGFRVPHGGMMTLKKSEERFDLAVRGTDAGIWDWDLRKNTVYYSPHWKGMLGYEEHEVSGHYTEWESRLHPEDRTQALAAVRDYLEGRTAAFQSEHRLRHKDGSYRWILSRGVKVCGHDGHPYRMVGSHLDITEWRRVVQELKEREACLIAARKIQEHLLPHSRLDAGGISVYGASFPADFGQGDYYDYHVGPEGVLTVTVADVCGHGIDAALLMAMLHAWLRSLAELRLDMTEILRRVDAVLLEQAGDAGYVTLLMLRIDPRTRACSYVNAGHPPGWVLDRSGAVKASLASLSVPLGIDVGDEFPTAGPVLLEPGDVIVLITDGAFEARSADRAQFGRERILEVVRQRLESPPEEIMKNLRAAIQEFTGTSELLDDVTFVVANVQ
jgi:PAS domain S-box-containing protein